MRPFRLIVPEEHAAALEQALSFALSTWTAQLQESDSAEWRKFAVDVHTIRNRLTAAPVQQGSRCMVLHGDIAGALQAVAGCCEHSGDNEIVALGAVTRQLARSAPRGNGSGAIS